MIPVEPGLGEESEESEEEQDSVQDGLQTFIFSATLSKELQRNVKKRSRPKGLGKKRSQQPASTLGKSLLLIDTKLRFNVFRRLAVKTGL